MANDNLFRRQFAAILIAGVPASILLRTKSASALQVPSGKAILTVSGAISVTNHLNEAIFDRAMLEALGMEAITTNTPWSKGPVRFEGVRMDLLMQVVGAKGSFVTAYSLNDYITKLPISDFARFKPILALKRNGEYMPVRDKGPLFIVYPYDSDPVLQQQAYYNRSAWQIASMVVE